MGESVLYCDTNSVIFIQKVGESPKVKTGDYLLHLTDELVEFGSSSLIQEFFSGGPKNYAFFVFCPSTGKHTTKCKVKGINLNYENSKVISFTPNKIKRNHSGVVSEPETKEYKLVFKKRWLMDNFDSLPYGYD